MYIVKILVVAILVVIVGSLGTAMFQLYRGGGDSNRMLKALTWRIGLSIGLFVLLMLAWRTGLITPHGVTR